MGQLEASHYLRCAFWSRDRWMMLVQVNGQPVDADGVRRLQMTPPETTIWAGLREPFHPKYVKFRVGSISTYGATPSAQLLAYIDARAVMRRLDQVVGAACWEDSYTPGPVGGVLCTLRIWCGDRWVQKQDVGTASDFEAEKGVNSDAFKRAAVKWGIGRYLHDLDGPWIDVQQRKIQNGIRIYQRADTRKNRPEVKGWCARPELPRWALPQPQQPQPQPEPPPAPRDKPQPQPQPQPQHPSWKEEGQRFHRLLAVQMEKLNRSQMDVEELDKFRSSLGLHPIRTLDTEKRLSFLGWMDRDKGRGAVQRWFTDPEELTPPEDDVDGEALAASRWGE